MCSNIQEHLLCLEREVFRLFWFGVPLLKATYSVAFSIFGTPGTRGTPDFKGVRYLLIPRPSIWVAYSG